MGNSTVTIVRWIRPNLTISSYHTSSNVRAHIGGVHAHSLIYKKYNTYTRMYTLYCVIKLPCTYLRVEYVARVINIIYYVCTEYRRVLYCLTVFLFRFNSTKVGRRRGQSELAAFEVPQCSRRKRSIVQERIRRQTGGQLLQRSGVQLSTGGHQREGLHQVLGNIW